MSVQAQQPAITPTETIPFYDGSASFRAYWEELQGHLDAVVGNGQFSQGPMVAVLEQRIRDYTGARHAIACNSGTDALIMLLRSCGIGPGDEVIVPCFSFVASASSIALVGATPVFADIAPDSFDICPDSVRAAITPRTRAIMPVHLFHQIADMSAIRTIAAEAGLMVIEDSAEGIGMRYDGVHAGLLGRGGVLSFFPSKTLGAFGDAGMILSDDDAVAEVAALMRHHGTDGHAVEHEAVVWGYNSKMDDIQAAVLVTRLIRLDAEIERRAALAVRYDRGLACLAPRVRVPRITSRPVPSRPVYYSYVIRAERKAALMAFLAGHGVQSAEYYPRPLHLQPCFAYLGYRSGDLPVAEATCQHALALPLYPDLSDAAVERVCELIRRFYGQAAAP